MTKHKPTNLRVAIPLQGKMGTRTFHTTHVKEVFLKESLQPCYFISTRGLDPGKKLFFMRLQQIPFECLNSMN